MNVTEALKSAGFKPEKSTWGDKPVYKGIYKATLFDVAEMADKGFGESIYAQFKIQEALEGDAGTSKYPEFKRYYNTAPDKIANKRNGLAALINGLFSVGVNIDTANVVASLQEAKGSEVYINAYPEEARKQDPVTKEWADDPDGQVKQGFNFMTKANAEKKAAKAKKPF